MGQEPEQAKPAGAASLMDSIRAKHQGIVDSKETTIPLPGYDGLLVAKYRLLNVKGELGAIGRKVEKAYKTVAEQGLYGTIDTMIMACIEILTTKEDGTLVPLSEFFGEDVPIRYDARLADFVGLLQDVENKTARQVVFAVFGDNEPMILEHGRKLSGWMRDTTRDVDDDFLAAME